MNSEKQISKRFATLIRHQRLAHAYLFVGPEDVGKSESALAVAKLVNCHANMEGTKEECCDKCPSCLKINSGNHPDIFIVDKGEEQSIKIARIRELVSRIQLRPFEARKKVFIIKGIEDLTLEGSNALLKTLEEPTDNSLLILTTSVPERNLGTIKSRCHAVHFFPLSKEKLAAELNGEYSIPEEASHFLAYFSEGCLGKAKRLNEKKFFDKKNLIIDNIVFQRENESYIKEILADQRQTQEALAVLLSWFRDVIFLKTQVEPGRLMHIDRVHELSRLAAQYSFNQVKTIIEGIVNTSKLLEENLNVKIPLSLLREAIWAKSCVQCVLPKN